MMDPIPCGHHAFLPFWLSTIVKATFNCVGQMVQQNPQMLEQIFQDGHNVENHSWNHPNFTKISLSEAKWQIEETNSLIERMVGVKPHFFPATLRGYQRIR